MKVHRMVYVSHISNPQFNIGWVGCQIEDNYKVCQHKVTDGRNITYGRSEGQKGKICSSNGSTSPGIIFSIELEKTEVLIFDRDIAPHVRLALQP